MARSSFKSFLQPDLLRKIQPRHLVSLLKRFEGALLERGFKFPQDDRDDVDCRVLAGILAEPDEKLNDLVEALYLIANVGVDEQFDELLEIAKNNCITTDDAKLTAPDLATIVYLEVPQALERLDRAESLQTRRKFESFIARDPKIAVDANILPIELSPLEVDLRQWFDSKKRGRRCTITRKDCAGEIRFLIQHGDPYTRQPSCDDVRSKSVIYRPERTDFVILDLIHNEMRINARHITEIKFYREIFCKRLFDDANRFVYDEKYTLKPLKRNARAALVCSDIDGMSSVVLKELEYRWPGPYDHSDRTRASDVLKALSLRWNDLRGSPEFVTARFSVKLKNEKRRRSVKIVSRNIAEYGRGDEGMIIEEWLRQRGFVLIGTAAKDEETDATMAGG